MSKQRKYPRNKSAGKGIQAPQQMPAAWIVAGVILLAAALFPILGATLPIIYDEHYTLREYACTSFSHIARTYDLPNNHIGFTWLLRAWLYVLDAADGREYLRPSLYALRLPIIAASLVTCAATFILSRRLLSRDVVIAALVCLMVMASPVVTYHSFQLRGYVPSMAYVSMALVLISFTSRIGWFWMVLVLLPLACIAQVTLPTNIWFLGPLILAATINLVASSQGWLMDQEYGNSHPAESSRGASTPNILFHRISQNHSALAALLSIASGVAVGLLFWVSLWPQLQAQNTQKTDNVSAFFRAIPTHLKLLGEGAGPFPGAWTNIIVAMAGTILIVVRMSRSDRYARQAAVLLPAFWLCVLLGAATAKVAFPRNFTVAAPVFSLLIAWTVLGATQFRKGRSDSKFVSIQLPRIVLGLMAVVATVNGARSMLTVYNEHRPNEAIAAVLSDNQPRSLIVHETYADALALDYYALRAGRQQPVSWDMTPKDLCQRVPIVYLIAGSDGIMDQMLKHYGIENAESGKLAKLGQFGKLQVRRYSRGQ